ncbi:MAG: ATP-binding cassette domain-containing protein, partial [Caulobacteraceae bacterium]
MIQRLSIEALALVRGERPLFDGFDLTMHAGEAVALTGANGAGKTSLLRAVAGLLRPAAGRIGFQGQDGELDPDEARSGGLHLLGHHDGLKPGRTAAEELAFWTRWLGGTARDQSRA